MGRRRGAGTLILIFQLLAGSTRASAEGVELWPQWRGPNRDAVSAEKGLLSSWSNGAPQLMWQSSGLGEGYSSVVISDGRLFTTGQRNNDVFAIALDATSGRKLWETQIGHTNRTPCSTPTVDRELVYALDPDGRLVCLKAVSGEIVWRKRFLDDFDGRMQSGRGYGESPLIDGEKLICTPGGKEAMLVALDKYSGVLIWAASIPEIGPQGRDGAGFSSVVISQAAGVRQYVQLVGRGLIGVDSEKGRFLWGYNRVANGTANIPTPIVRDDLVFSANGYSAGSVLLQLIPNGKGGVNAREVYYLSGASFQNHHGGVVLIDDFVYGGHGNNNGLPTCLDLKTGELRWKRRGPGVGSAAVVYADGHLYFRYQNGLVALIEVNPENYRLKGTFNTPGSGGDSWAHPVVAGGKLYLREKDSLLAYDIRKQEMVSKSLVTQTLSSPSGPAVTGLKRLGVRVGETEVRLGSLLDYHRRLHQPIRPKGGQDRLSVSINNSHLTDRGTLIEPVLAVLKEARFPLELNLGGSRISPAGIEQLKEINHIEILNLELCEELTDDGLALLKTLTNLKTLILAGTGVTDSGLVHLRSLEMLAGLDLDFCEEVTDAGLVHLRALTNLQWLSLKGTRFAPRPITDSGLKHLRELTKLELLDLSGTRITDVGLAQLNGMTRLKVLNMGLTGLTDVGLAQLKGLHDLERLDLTSTEGLGGPKVSDAGVHHLTALSNLRHLSLIGADVSDASLGQLVKLTRLRSLNLIGTQVTTEGLRKLKFALPNCEIKR